MFNPFTYLREVFQELKQVSWPTLRQTAGQTMLVISASIILGMYMGVLDLGFQKLLEILVTR